MVKYNIGDIIEYKNSYNGIYLKAIITEIHNRVMMILPIKWNSYFENKKVDHITTGMGYYMDSKKIGEGNVENIKILYGNIQI